MELLGCNLRDLWVIANNSDNRRGAPNVIIRVFDEKTTSREFAPDFTRDDIATDLLVIRHGKPYRQVICCIVLLMLVCKRTNIILATRINQENTD